MLVIRNKQLDVLSTAQRTSFDHRMLVHLKKFHRAQYDGLGEEGVVEAVHSHARPTTALPRSVTCVSIST